MIEIFTEDIKSDFEGTIIDLETIGNFDNRYGDSRRYKDIIPAIFGFINKDGIQVLCAKNQNSLLKLKSKIVELESSLKKPFYAFNTHFEKGVLFYYLNKEITFERELNSEKYESKRSAVYLLKIPNYEDPFNDNGLLCSQAWLRGDIENAILHNRSCLLKERDILIKRGYRKPDKLRLIG
ncbi:MAG: hypothetical protein E3J87_09110 [Candidatus Cloacimonadota bacterium]|nr:MAG: hypothetical protein E3J87_09110 [Candidatus Cloacimonadota bacterium]